MKFTKQIRSSIYKILVEQWKRISREGSEKAIKLLGAIWDLHIMDSEDIRFNNAQEDIIQHYFNNDDWTTDVLFLDRLKLYEESTDFKKYIEVMLDPQFYESLDDIMAISTLVNVELKKIQLNLITVAYSDLGLPLQQISERDTDSRLPFGVKSNEIPFYVEKNSPHKGNGDKHFTLTPNKGWNDFNVVSIFDVYYYDNHRYTNLGTTKIIHREGLITWEKLPDKFFLLSDDFCSLSGSLSFYKAIQKLFGNQEMVSILFALQDAAYFPDIHDSYEKNGNFKSSLIRGDSAERLLRELRPTILGADLSNLYSFQYKFKPPYSRDPIRVELDFNNSPELPNRIIGIIGKNGTGKTQLMTSLPNSLAKNIKDDFYSNHPVFSKVIAVSYSVFDSFAIPQKNAEFNYVYCGLKDEDGDLRSNKGLVISFHHNWKKIEEMGRTRKWRTILKNFIDVEVLDSFILLNPDPRKEYQVSVDGFNSVKSQFSSGQSILLYIITQVVANIRLDSLILYDEPETHLHPNAIVQLMNTIYNLVDEFESYCLIATHSPLIIRELLSRNVYIMERSGNTPSIRRIGIESFGENLSILSEEVFGDRETQKPYRQIIDRWVDEGKTFDEIVERLEFDDRPLSLNARIFIQNQIRIKDEEH